MVGGVCAGLAAHLGLAVAGVRLAMVAAAFMAGAGVLLYLLLWAFVPAGDPWAEAAGQVPPARARLASRLQSPSDGASRLSANATTLLGGGALVLAALLITVWRAGYLPAGQWLLPALVIAAGAALSWSQIDAVTGPERDRGATLRLAGGVVLAAVGILLVIGADTPPRVLLTGALTGGALVICIALVLAPVWLQTNRAMNQARAAEVREAERADIAAHLHDSVLQTLTLIRKRADEPETVARLARSQERELRAWLYTDRPEAGTSVADAVRDLVGEIEDRYGVGIDLVIVGDRAPDRETEVVVAAAREALSNAVRHGAPPVSGYAEIAARAWRSSCETVGPASISTRSLPTATACASRSSPACLATVARPGSAVWSRAPRSIWHSRPPSPHLPRPPRTVPPPYPQDHDGLDLLPPRRLCLTGDWQRGSCPPTTPRR